jgi:type I restriction enzyme S subunit
MANEWAETTLGAVADFLSGGTPSKDRADYWGGTIPWVTAKDMKRFRLEDTQDHVTENGAENGTKVVPAGTVFLLTRGMTLLNDVPICVAGQPMAFNQDVKALRPKSGVLNEFLPYLLLGHKERLLSSVDLAGHGTGRLNSDQLRRLDVRLPPEPEQRAIAHILGTLDDKIELNRKQNETLEGMARALFKAWFVDFEPVRAKMEGRWQRGHSLPGLPAHLYDLFPGRLVESELGEIPEGWTIARAGEIYDVGIGKTPPRKEFHWFSENPKDIPWMSIKDLGNSGAYISEVSEYLTAEAVERFRVRRIPANTVVLSFKLTVGRVAITDSEMLSNEAIAHFIPKEGNRVSAPYLYCYLKQFDYGSLGSTSSIATAVNSNGVRSIPILVPNEVIGEAFEEFVNKSFAQIRSMQRESHSLAQLRNTLLPKLISGELRMPNAERIVSGLAQ